MATALFLLISDAVLINLGFLIAFVVRYHMTFPERNFLPYKEAFVFLTLIFILALSLFRSYETRFKCSWDLFKRIFLGMFFGSLLSIAFVYVFRARWAAFPTTIFIISTIVNLVLVFTFNYSILKILGKIRKKVVVIGDCEIGEMLRKSDDIVKLATQEIEKVNKLKDIDEIIICQEISNKKDLHFLVRFAQKLKINVLFNHSTYLRLLANKVNGEDSIDFLSTSFGKNGDMEEFLIRALDIGGSLVILFVAAPVIILISLLIKITTPGQILHKQERVGKDGKIFTLYKFRTMFEHAEKTLGPVWATPNDPRVTKIGKVLRVTRSDELPQLFNVLRGDMSLVGPRPERPHFVKAYDALRELRLAVRPGLTGLAQIRGSYDLKPLHKIKYDYLYMKRRSLPLNLYILAQTIPVILFRKGQ